MTVIAVAVDVIDGAVVDDLMRIGVRIGGNVLVEPVMKAVVEKGYWCQNSQSGTKKSIEIQLARGSVSMDVH